MPDILIRDVPDDVVAAIDAKAQRAGLSRTEYLRRALSRGRTEESAGPSTTWPASPRPSPTSMTRRSSVKRGGDGVAD